MFALYQLRWQTAISLQMAHQFIVKIAEVTFLCALEFYSTYDKFLIHQYITEIKTAFLTHCPVNYI